MTLPAWAKPYKYKKPRVHRDQRLRRIPGAPEDEGLTGFVHGEPASDLEERFAKALDRLGLVYQFQVAVPLPTAIPGEEKQIDFVVDDGTRSPVEIDGGFMHKSAEQKEQDRVRDAQIDEALQRRGYRRLVRVSGGDIATPEDADQVARQLFYA